MSITHNSNIVLDVEPNGVHGHAGLAVHRLRFSVKYRSPARKETFIATNFRALVSVSKGHIAGMHLGVAFPENAWTMQTQTFAQHAAILFDYDLTNEQLGLIEELRSGGDLVFTVQLHCEVTGEKQIEAGHEEVRFNVNRSSWIEVMKQFGIDRIVLLEIRLPTGDGELETAVSLVKHAREEIDSGNYDGAVQQCRRAIESVEKALNLGAEIQLAMDAYCKGGERRKMTKRARSLAVYEAVLHYAHLAHHVDEDGRTFDYGRRDATFMLALASAVVANATASSTGA